MKEALLAKSCSFFSETHTNQLFPILPDNTIKTLSKHFEFHTWKKIDESNSAIRLITSWATTDDQVEHFVQTLEKE
jgi:threonine aldolase